MARLVALFRKVKISATKQGHRTFVASFVLNLQVKWPNGIEYDGDWKALA